MRGLAAGTGLLLLLSASAPSFAQEADRLICLDRDAGAASPLHAGSVFNLSATDPEARVITELAARFNAFELEFVGGLTASAFDELVYFSDYRGAAVEPGRIWSMGCGAGATEVVLEDARLVKPLGLAALADGTLLVVDADADPAGLGPDSAGGVGSGALYRFNPADGTLSLLADGTLHEPLAGVGPSAFQEPVAVAVDEAGTIAWVLDALADPLLDPGAPRAPHRGAVYRVEIATGQVALLASDPRFGRLTDLDRRPNGQLVLVDGLAGDSIVWLIDPAGVDPERNAIRLSAGQQYAELFGVGVDAAGQVFVTDLGVWDGVLGRFLVPPAVYRIDEGVADPEANAVLVTRQPRLVTPIGLVADPACPATAGALLVTAPLGSGDHGSAFDPACVTPGYRICGDEFVPVEEGRVSLSGLPGLLNFSITFLEHSDFLGLRLQRDGDELIVTGE